MAGLKEIKRRIKSVKNTRKITYAMKLVSAAKLKKAQDAVTASRAYTDTLFKLTAELSREQAGSEFTHPLMEKREQVKNVRFLVVGGSRGLCGGYNTNVNKKVEQGIKEVLETNPDANISTVIVGKKPAEYARRIKREYLASYEDLPEDPNTWPIDDICKEIELAYTREEIDEVYLVFTKFRSALSQTAMCEKLIPLEGEAAAVETSEESAEPGITLFEPSAEEVFSAVVPRIVRSKVRQASLDAKASEHGSRMTAMDSATTNAGELISKLTLLHNRLRQSGITSELLDIIGGAEALE